MEKPSPRLEVCVDSFAGSMAAIQGGLDWIELCSSLDEGGLTLSAGLMQAAEQTGNQCHAMIRPHAGDFNYDQHDIENNGTQYFKRTRLQPKWCCIRN